MDAVSNSFFSSVLNLGDDVVVNGFRQEVTDDGFSRIVIDATPASHVRHCCPHCESTGTYYDTPRSKEGPKEWVSLPLGSTRTVITFKPERIRCPKCGIVTAAVPWAYYNSGFTKAFDHQVAWLSLHMNRDAIADFMGIAWETVWKAVDRVVSNSEGSYLNRITDLVEIGIDENAYGRGYNKFVMVVYNHQTNEIVWVKEGRSSETISSFFKGLTEEQRAKIKLVSVDGADWIHDVVKNFCPNAKICLDTFHVFQWISDAANEVRLEICKEKEEMLKNLKEAKKELKNQPKRSRSAQTEKFIKQYDKSIERLEEEIELLKGGKRLLIADPANLNDETVEKQKRLIAIDPKLKKIFEEVQYFREMMDSDNFDSANDKFDEFIAWAKKCRMESFKKLAKTLVNFKEQILNTAQYKLTNGMVESTNNTIKFIIRQSYGFRNIDNLIKAIKFRCSQRYLKLPNRISRRILRSEWHLCHAYNPSAA